MSKITYAAGLCGLMLGLQGQNRVWTSALGGNWSATSNWQGGLIADGPGEVADFGAVNINAFTTVNLDGPRTVGGLRVNDTPVASHSWIFSSLGDPANVLTLNNDTPLTSGPPVITVESGLQAPRYIQLRTPLAGGDGFIKAGLGTLWLDANNSALNGEILIRQGTVRATHPAALGSEPVRLELEGVTNVNTNWLRLDFGTGRNELNQPVGLTFTNDLIIGPFIGPSGAALTVTDASENIVTTLTGDISVRGSGAAGGLLAGPTATGSRLELTGPIFATDTAGLTQRVTGGHVRLGGGGTVTSWQNSAYLSLGADEGLSGAGSVSLSQGVSAPATFDLNGYDQTLATLTRSGRSLVTNTLAGDANRSVLTINNPTNTTYEDSLAGNLSLVKRGNGTFTLSSTSTTLTNVIPAGGSSTLTVPDTAGLAVGQLVGGFTVNGNTTQGSTNVPVISTVGLLPGMSVASANVPPGARIASINGNTVVLNVAATGTGATVPLSFSPFPLGTTITAINNGTQVTLSANALVGATDLVPGFTLVLPSAHTYSGPTVLNGGTYSISVLSDAQVAGGLGRVATVSPDFLIFEGGALRYTDPATFASTNRGFTVRDGVNAVWDIVSGTANVTLSGSSPFSATGGFEKRGAGRLILTGNHLYEGPTLVSTGKLDLFSVGSLAPASTVFIKTGATFDAAGSVGTVIAEDGGTFAIGPGGTIGTLTATNVTIQPDSTLQFEFAGGSTHDRLIVTNPGGLDIQGGKLNVYRQNGSVTENRAGTYSIIDYAGSFTGVLDDVAILNSNPDFTYQLVDRPGSTDIALVIAPIVARSWSAAGGGDWFAGGNWSGGNVPNAFGQSATFGTSIFAASTITVNAPVTTTGLTFSSTRAYTLEGTGPLRLDAGSAEVDIRLTSAGAHSINVPVLLDSNLRLATITNSSLTFGGDITTDGTASLTGGGTVTFAGAASFSSITVDAGTLRIGSGGTTGSVSADQITLTNQGKLALNRSDDIFFDTQIIGGTLIHAGSGTTTLAATGNSYGTLSLQAGTVRLTGNQPNPEILIPFIANLVMDTPLDAGNAPVSVGALDLNGLNLSFSGLWSGTGGRLTDLSETAGTTIFTYASGANSTFKGAITDGPERTLSLVKRFTTNLSLDPTYEDSTFSGGATVNGGTLTALKTSAFGTGPVLLDVEGVGSSSNFARLVLGNDVVLPNAVTLNRPFPNGTASIALLSTALSGGIAGPITIQNGTTNGVTFRGGTGSGTTARYLTLSGPINAPGLTLSSDAAVRYSAPAGTSDFEVLQHRTGTLALGADNALPGGVQLFLAQSNNTTFNLFGYDQELEQIVRASNNYTATVTNTVNDELSTLTLTPSTAVTFSGTFQGNLSLVKNSVAGDLTLTGSNTHTGITQVNAGGLILSAGGRITASQVMLANGAQFSIADVSIPTLALGGGLGGNGSVNSTGKGLTIAQRFEPAGLSITTNSLTFSPTTQTVYDVSGPFTFDTLAVTGPMTNAGFLNIAIAPGANLSTGRELVLATASGGIARGFTNVRINDIPLVRDSSDLALWAGTVGTNQYTYHEIDGTLTVVSGSAQSALDAWLEANVTNPADRTWDADPDGDGISNLMEYATGSNPMVSNALNVTVARVGDRLTLTYNRTADAALTYTVTGVDDLANPDDWETVDAANNPLTGTVADSVTVTDSELLSETPRRFLRLEVNYNF